VVYLAAIIVLRAVTREDFALLPKGEKAGKIPENSSNINEISIKIAK
jgi:hypothetical protein